MENQNNPNYKEKEGFKELSDAEIEASSIFSKPQIEHKKPPKNKNILLRTIIALGVVALLIAAVLLINKFFGKGNLSSQLSASSTEVTEAETFKAVGISPNDIISLTLTNGYGTVEFYSQEGTNDNDSDGKVDKDWYVKGINKKYIDTESTYLTVGDCASVEYLFERDEQEGIDYGFSNPEAIIEVKAKDGNYTITVAKKFKNSSMEGAYLKLSNKPSKVYVLASENIDYFTQDVSYYISNMVPTAVPQTKNNSEYFADTLDSFDYVEFSGELVKAGDVRIEMYGRENSNLLYKMITPAYTHVDGEKIGDLLAIMKEDLEGSEVYYFNKDGIPDKVLKEYNLDKPQATLNYKAGDAVVSIKLAQSKTDKNYYSMVVEGVPAIYMVSRLKFEFFEYSRVEFATSSVVLENIDGLKALELNVGGKDYAFDISKKVTEHIEDEEQEQEELLVKYDGKTINKEYFSNYYSYLLAITPYISDASLITEKPADAKEYISANFIVKDGAKDSNLSLKIYKMEINPNRYFIELDGNAIGLCSKDMADKAANNIEKLINNKKIEAIL